MVHEYCCAFSRHLARSGHQVILTTVWTYENLITEEIVAQTDDPGRTKKIVEYFISDNEPVLPRVGTVIQFEAHKWWGTERTLFVERADAVVVIGGIPGIAAKFWKKFSSTM